MSLRVNSGVLLVRKNMLPRKPFAWQDKPAGRKAPTLERVSQKKLATREAARKQARQRINAVKSRQERSKAAVRMLKASKSRFK